MRSTWAFLLACATGLAAIAAPAQDQAGTGVVAPYQAIPGISPEPIVEGSGLRGVQDLEAFLDGVMKAQLRAQNAAGAVVAVVKDGQLYFAKGYGYADVEKQIPVDAERTLFRPGSVSKMVTWTALMQLVEQGKVDLDADVNDYITQFKIPDTYPGQPITVRHLFTHTPGMEDGGIDYLIVDQASRMDSLVDALANHIPHRVRPPVTDWNNGDVSSYSNWCTTLAGLIIENVSGMSFEDYLDKHIFAPLGMTQSTFRQPLPEALAASMSEGYGHETGLLDKKDFEYVNFPPAGSLSATATDMGKFMLAHLQEGALGDARILSPESARLMHSRVLSPNPHLNGAALGFYENYVNGRRLLVHAGDTQWFHSELNLLPEESLGIFYSINSGPTLPFSTRGDLLQAFMNRYYPATLPQLKAPEDFAERAGRYAGTYRFNRHSYTTIEKMFALAPGISVMPSERNSLLINFGLPVSWEFIEISPSVFRRADDGATIAFREDADGRVTYLLNAISLPSIQAYKLAWHEKPGFHWFVLGFGALCFIIAVVSALRHWRRDRQTPTKARWARRLAGILGACQLLFLILLGISVAILVKDLFAGYPSLLYASLVLPLLSIPLTLAVLAMAVIAWREGYWSRYSRVQYSVIALAGAAFLWSLNTWNLVGYKFG